MRTTVELPDDLLRRAKAVAALRGIKLKDLITSCLEKGLSSPENEPQKSGKGRLPKEIRKATGSKIPALSNAELEKLLIQDNRGI